MIGSYLPTGTMAEVIGVVVDVDAGRERSLVRPATEACACSASERTPQRVLTVRVQSETVGMANTTAHSDTVVP